MVEVGSPLPGESTPVVDALVVLVEIFLPAPVVELVAPVVPLVAEDAAPAPALSCAALALLDVLDAPAPVATCAAPARVDAVRARVTEHVAPMTLDVYDAALMEILSDFHQSVQRILAVPPLAEFSTSTSSACAPAATYTASAPVDEYVAPAFAVTCAEQILVDEHSAPAPDVSHAALAPVTEGIPPAPSMFSC